MTTFTHIRNNKEIISVILSLINTVAIVIALIIGINEFVIKEERSVSSKLENSFLLMNELYSRGPLKDNYANYDFENFSILNEMVNNSPIGEDINDILGIYQKISFCIDIDKCDELLIIDRTCAVALQDAEILQKSIVQEIERGGVFIDRIRVFEFFDFIKRCLNVGLKAQNKSHKNFLDTYKREIEFIKRYSQRWKTQQKIN